MKVKFYSSFWEYGPKHRYRAGVQALLNDHSTKYTQHNS